MEHHRRRVLIKLNEPIQQQLIGDLNLKFKKIRVEKLLFRSPNPLSLTARKLTLSLRGFDTHIDATNRGNNFIEQRRYFFCLPIGEGEFTTYVNSTSGDGGTWDFETQNAREIETSFEIETLLDDVGFTAVEGEELYVELTFSL